MTTNDLTAKLKLIEEKLDRSVDEQVKNRRIQEDAYNNLDADNMPFLKKMFKIEGSKYKINADYITTGDLNAINITGCTITGGSLNINDTFIVSSAGAFTATSGNIAGWLVTANAISSTYVDNLNPHVVNGTINLYSAASSSEYWIGTWNYANETGFSINRNGELWANNAVITGTIYATNGVFHGTVYAKAGGSIGGWEIREASLYYNNEVNGYIEIGDSGLTFLRGDSSNGIYFSEFGEFGNAVACSMRSNSTLFDFDSVSGRLTGTWILNGNDIVTVNITNALSQQIANLESRVSALEV